MKLHAILGAMLLSGAFLFSGLAVTEVNAQQTVSLYNHSRGACSAAFIYKNYHGTWEAKGWFTARAGEERDIQLPSNNSVIYTYSYCGKRV